ncbi:MAG: nucleotide pyrophosphohydrolase [Oscillospiraceae bacterium]|nr:nucleotide pyrophosphohydrolase [Oscillospiraceae bacterium]
MEEFTISEMKDMQRQLQEKYKDKWEGISPEVGKHQLLWMIGEIGEVIDIVKKRGSTAIMEDPTVRAHFVEEMADVLMYYSDLLLCFDISSEDLKRAYTAKFRQNLNRW